MKKHNFIFWRWYPRVLSLNESEFPKEEAIALARKCFPNETIRVNTVDILGTDGYFLIIELKRKKPPVFWSDILGKRYY